MGKHTGTAASRRHVWVAAVFVVAALLAACSGSGGSDAGDSANGPVLEPVSSTGSDPFMSSVAVKEVAEFPSSVNAVTKKVRAEATPASANGGVVISGSVPGLYGGTSDEAVCDAAKLIDFLDAHPDEAKAWAEVEGISADEIGDFVAGLTPVVLTADTWVTNHGFKDGKALPRQSVLQAGTAVLVDDTGVPRVKCGCGNPLLAPERSGVDVATPTGDKWEGYDPQLVTEVEPAKTPIPVFTTTDVQSGEPIQTEPVGGGEQLIVAVGGDNRSSILVSTDGATWEEVFTDGKALSGVAVGGGQWIAVGSQGSIYGSDDGRSWKDVATVEDTLTDVAYADGTWLAVGFDGSAGDRPGAGAVYRSDDGTRWEKTASVPTPVEVGFAAHFTSVTHGPAGWMAAMESSVSASNSQVDVFTSEDGTTWTLVSALAGGGSTDGVTLESGDVAFGDGTYVVLGASFVRDASGGPNYRTVGGVLKSPDGTTWSGKATVPAQSFTGPFWDGSRWLAVTVGEGTQFATSPDAVTWTIGSSLPNLASDVAASGTAPKEPAEPAEPSGTDLAGFDFANFTVPQGCGTGPDQPDVVLTAGDFRDPRGDLYGGAQLVQPVRFVDVDGDGTKEALVELICTSGGNSVVSVVSVFAGGEGGPVRLGEPLIGSLTSGELPDGTIDLHEAEYAASDPRCCPSAEKVTTYQYVDGGFQVVNTVILPND